MPPDPLPNMSYSRPPLPAGSHTNVNQSQHTPSQSQDSASDSAGDSQSTGSHSLTRDEYLADNSDNELCNEEMGGMSDIRSSAQASLVSPPLVHTTELDTAMTNALYGSSHGPTSHVHDEDMTDTDGGGGVALSEHSITTDMDGMLDANSSMSDGAAELLLQDVYLTGMGEEQADDEDSGYPHFVGTQSSADEHVLNAPPDSPSVLQPPLDEDVDFGLWTPHGLMPAPLSVPTFLETPFLALGYHPANSGEDLQPPFAPSSIAPIVIGPDNFSLFEFLRYWAQYGRGSGCSWRSSSPCMRQVHAQASLVKDEVRYGDLRGDRYDMQGLDWTAMEVDREIARSRRLATYKNYVNRTGTDQWNRNLPERELPITDSFFRFNRMTIRRDVSLTHFQLRSVLACPSRSQIYYTSPKGINRLNPLNKKTDVVLDLNETAGFGRAITTLDAKCGVLVGGTFNGDICVTPIDYSSRKAQTTLIDGFEGIANHVQIQTQRRSASPVVSVACNDLAVRVLDLQSEEFIQESEYEYALNATAISPDRRLRMLVGDSPNAVVADAETGEPLVELTGHRDNGFACDWSDDGVTVATGFQDKSIKIWDARHWTNSKGEGTPLASIWCDMAGARNLRFSPLGSGHPVLVATEEADFVNIIDAKSFSSKQSIDVFGELGGVDFTDDGRELNVLVSDYHRGGLIQLERCRTSISDDRPFMLEAIEAF